MQIAKWNLQQNTTPWDNRNWSYMTGGISSELQMYKNEI